MSENITGLFRKALHKQKVESVHVAIKLLATSSCLLLKNLVFHNVERGTVNDYNCLHGYYSEVNA